MDPIKSLAEVGWWKATFNESVSGNMIRTRLEAQTPGDAQDGGASGHVSLIEQGKSHRENRYTDTIEVVV